MPSSHPISKRLYIVKYLTDMQPCPQDRRKMINNIQNYKLVINSLNMISELLYNIRYPNFPKIYTHPPYAHNTSKWETPLISDYLLTFLVMFFLEE